MIKHYEHSGRDVAYLIGGPIAALTILSIAVSWLAVTGADPRLLSVLWVLLTLPLLRWLQLSVRVVRALDLSPSGLSARDALGRHYRLTWSELSEVQLIERGTLGRPDSLAILRAPGVELWLTSRMSGYQEVIAKIEAEAHRARKTRPTWRDRLLLLQ